MRVEALRTRVRALGSRARDELKCFVNVLGTRVRALVCDVRVLG